MKSRLKIEQLFNIIDKLIELYPDNVEGYSRYYGSRKDILYAEKKLGVKFPEDFEKFILKYGHNLNFWGGKVFGTGSLGGTLDSRALGEGDKKYFPEHLIWICDIGGAYVCIDTFQDNQIIFWEQEMAGPDENGSYASSNDEMMFDSFKEFLFYYLVYRFEYNAVEFSGILESKRVEVEKEIEYLKTLSSYYNKDKPYLTLV